MYLTALMWLIHGFLIWYFFQDLQLALIATAFSALFATLVLLINHRFTKPYPAAPVLWSPWRLAYCIALSWFIWALLTPFFSEPGSGVQVWPAIAYIVLTLSARSERKKTRRAQDLGV